MSKAFERFCRILELSMPLAVELSTLIGVGGCLCPRACNVWRTGTAACALITAVVVSASAADAMTWRIVLHSTRMGALSGGSLAAMGSWELR